MELTVGEVARVTGLTVRALHHYDRVGLVVPSGRSSSGYRLYGEGDLERLHRVMAYRELGFGLDQIATIVDDPAVDTATHLRRQHALLEERIARLTAVARSVEKALDATQMGIDLTPEERFEVFGEHDPAGYQAEAEDRWGDTDAWAQSRRRTSSYTKDDWLRMKAEGAEVSDGLLTAYRAGEAPDSVAAMDAVEAHRQHITRWFYDCSPAMQVGLAEMYLADPRFTAFYEDQAEGLAQYVHDAIVANAARHGDAG
jgi:MerR family transcriptional regulator, thiopeptide resistance regulator